jgi:simple sugar transport system permease protein
MTTFNRALIRIGLGLAPFVLSLALTALIIVVVGAEPGAVFQSVLEGAFRSTNAVGGVINFWIPLVLCCMGLIVTFTAGLWNIGVEGQMILGGVAASFIAITLGERLPNTVLIPLSIIAAMIGGGAWGALVGFLKIRLGVNEIFGGVGLNALASLLVIHMITGPWQPPEGGSAQATAPFPDAALYPRLSADFPISLVALALAIIAVIGVLVALRGTRWGLQLKATGKNARSALLLGVPTRQSVMTAFIVCGVLAGIAGSYRVLLTYASLRPGVSGGIGFLALLVVLVASTRAIWAAVIAFVFAVILGGSTRLRVALQLDPSLAGVLQGLIVLCVLLMDGVRQRLRLTKDDEHG